MNSFITVAGNITRDPEIRFSENGKPIVRFGLAETYRDKNKNERTSFYDVTVFGTSATNTADSLQKGQRVIVAGRQEVRTFDRNDGTKGSVTEIVADEIGASLRFNTVTVNRTERTSASVPSDSFGGYEEF